MNVVAKPARGVGSGRKSEQGGGEGGWREGASRGKSGLGMDFWLIGEWFWPAKNGDNGAKMAILGNFDGNIDKFRLFLPTPLTSGTIIWYTVR